MAEETIRSIVVKLGYEVDTTGSDIFKSRFESFQKALEQIAENTRKSLKPKKMFPIGPLEKRVRLMGKRLRRQIRKSLRISPANFKKLESDLKFISTVVKKGFDKAKTVAIAGGVALAGALAAGAKVFTGFATVEQARGSLEFRAGDQFDEILKKIDEVRGMKGIKGLISELDTLNAINLGADIIGDLDFIVGNFETVVKLAKVLGKDVGEVQQAFSTFIATGTNLQELVKFGFFTPEQIDALSKASTDFSQQGLETRKQLLSGKIEEAKPRLDENFEKFTKRSQATIDRLGVATEDTIKIIGEKLNPAINKIVNGLTISVDKYREELKKSGSFIDAYTKSFNSDIAKKFISFFGGVTSDNGPSTNVQDNSTTTVNINGSNLSKEEMAEAVRTGIAKDAKKVIQSSARKNVPQALNTTIIPNVSP